MELFSIRSERKLKLNYKGQRIAASDILFKPIKITHFEIVESWQNPGKDCLVFQAVRINSDTGEVVENMVLTESYEIIKTIKGTQSALPHYTKIVRDRSSRSMYFSKLNDKEKSPLLDL